MGSPPRVREPHDGLCYGDLCGRITPACAGTTLQREPSQPVGGDHPRVCGNHWKSVGTLLGNKGSPPRVREPHDLMYAAIYKLRITPACAGTTSSIRTTQKYAEDHPRVCGNHRTDKTQLPLFVGSPPRVREPRFLRPFHNRGSRITPACAGTTGYEQERYISGRDHPRVCGNHLYFISFLMLMIGSPPRVREPLFLFDLLKASSRITPACAGTTL